MCVIRSGQNWAACEGDEKKFYLEKVHPTLLAGMRFLRDNPVESGCYSLRFVLEKDTGWGAMERSFGLGYALDAYAFEEWAKTHPTHLAILGSFMEMVNTFGMDIKLALWHEVTALPKQDCEFEASGIYLNVLGARFRVRLPSRLAIGACGPRRPRRPPEMKLALNPLPCAPGPAQAGRASSLAWHPAPSRKSVDL